MRFNVVVDEKMTFFLDAFANACKIFVNLKYQILALKLKLWRKKWRVKRTANIPRLRVWCGTASNTTHFLSRTIGTNFSGRMTVRARCIAPTFQTHSPFLQ